MIMSELFSLFQQTYGHEVTPRVRRDYARMFETLDDHFGYMEVTQVKPRHVAEFINEPGKGKVHRNRHVMILNMVFLRAMGSWCIDFDLHNPCTPVRRHPTKPRDRYITDVEFYGFREIAPATVQVAMDLAYLLGQRQGDVIGLKWSDVEFTAPFKVMVDEIDREGNVTQVPVMRHGWINIDQGKTGKKLAIAISEKVLAVLNRAKLLEPQLPREYVVHTKFGRRYTGDGFRALWQVYMRAWRKAHPGVSRFTFHDIRAKAVSDNKSLTAASQLAGHADPRITNRVYDRNRRQVQPLG